MPAIAATLAVVAPLVLAGEKGLFHFPGADEVRLQKLSRADNEQEWPFTVSSGYLACVWSAGKRMVMFLEEPAKDEAEPARMRKVFVSVNPFELTLGNMADRDLIVPMDSVEALVKRMAPFAALGERLCDQPQGSKIRQGEL
ncbi:hypothetical protein G6N74_24975 [Mesorhizobium sp. CGMCC 1.15528]|uniref:Uncharacterized protein n=1 Tax=Mesorhizobium zhangyense TaxID=1776730 RepID=A0A7C9VFR2_9HYPH|nr:hypothetical protein [Mesorhizobium zhangyense]NGN44329.1 hypothetical protein [Mesorhizobium zhangyense]